MLPEMPGKELKEIKINQLVLLSNHSFTDPTQRWPLDTQVRGNMIKRYRIENIRMLFHHLPVTVLRGLKQKPFRVNHNLMKSRFGDNPAKPFPLV